MCSDVYFNKKPQKQKCWQKLRAESKVKKNLIEAKLHIAYAVRKKGDLSDSARQALNRSADRSKELVRKLAGSTEAHSKELLSHSLEKVSGWLGKMADKVKPKA